MNHILLVAVGGALGSVARYLTGLATLRWFGPGYPWGTLAVNLIGGFFMGILAGVLVRTGGSENTGLFFGVGILGGFTTFSAFSLDAVMLWERGEILTALAYVLTSVVLSIAALAAGLLIMRAAA